MGDIMKKTLNRKGFTLVELLVAMSIISLIATAFFTILKTSIKSNKNNEQNIKLLNVAISEVENIREQIKDTSTEEIKLNEDISIDTWNTGGNKVKYTKNIDGFECDIEFNISRNKISTSNMYIYDIKINSQLKNKYFTKKTTEINTKVFGR